MLTRRSFLTFLFSLPLVGPLAQRCLASAQSPEDWFQYPAFDGKRYWGIQLRVTKRTPCEHFAWNHSGEFQKTEAHHIEFDAIRFRNTNGDTLISLGGPASRISHADFNEKLRVLSVFYSGDNMAGRAAFYVGKRPPAFVAMVNDPQWTYSTGPWRQTP